MRNCFLVEYERLDYRKSLELQRQLRVRKESNRDYDDFLLVLQHNHVFTIGKKGSKDDILAPENLLKEEGIDVVNVKRGGEVTYHGPGQLVGYLHLNLSRANLSVNQFVWNMEEVLIQLLEDYGIKGWRLEGYPGVWINHQARKWKIGSIGARASKMISSHGLALNVNTDMDHFQMIVPCGITEFSPISMKQVLEKTLNITEIYNKFEQSFEKIFKMKLEKITSDKLEEMIK
jgi:lipoate-protein ligase B